MTTQKRKPRMTTIRFSPKKPKADPEVDSAAPAACPAGKRMVRKILDEIEGMAQLARRSPTFFAGLEENPIAMDLAEVWDRLFEALSGAVEAKGWGCFCDVVQFVEAWRPASQGQKRRRGKRDR